jgi:hypothetical protein
MVAAVGKLAVKGTCWEVAKEACCELAKAVC